MGLLSARSASSSERSVELRLVRSALRCTELRLEAATLLEVVETTEHTSIITQLGKFDTGGLKDDITQLAL